MCPWLSVILWNTHTHTHSRTISALFFCAEPKCSWQYDWAAARPTLTLRTPVPEASHSSCRGVTFSTVMLCLANTTAKDNTVSTLPICHLLCFNQRSKKYFLLKILWNILWKTFICTGLSQYQNIFCSYKSKSSNRAEYGSYDTFWLFLLAKISNIILLTAQKLSCISSSYNRHPYQRYRDSRRLMRIHTSMAADCHLYVKWFWWKVDL